MKIRLTMALFLGMTVCAVCMAETTNTQDLFPEKTRALGVFLKNKSTNEEIEVGRVEAGKGYQRKSLDDCREMATEEAGKRRIDDWDYYCCTVTKENDCVTKLKALH